MPYYFKLLACINSISNTEDINVSIKSLLLALIR